MAYSTVQKGWAIQGHNGSDEGLRLGPSDTLVTATAAELNTMDGVTATAAEINQAADLSANLIAAGATLTISSIHHNTTVALDQATGSVITLPAATGTGLKVKFIVSVSVTSNLHSINCAGTDEYAGVIYQVDTDTTDTVAAYPALAADNFDAIDMDGSTKGGLIGDWIELVDIASGVWALKGHTNASGVVASPLSAT